MANLTEFIESIQEKSLRTKIVILVAIIVVISGIYWYFLWSPRAVQLERSRDKLVQLQKKLREYELIAAQLPEFELEFKRLNREFEVASLKLPKEKEIPTLIDGVYSQVSASGLEPVNFVPKGEAKKDIYAEIPIQMKVTGSYLQLVNFFERISNLPRIVNVRDLKLNRDNRASKDNDIVLNADFTAVTFRVLPITEDQEGAADTGKRKRKRTPKK